MNQDNTSSPAAGCGVTLSEVLSVLGDQANLLRGNAETRVDSVSQDSRTVAPGCLFTARLGGKVSGLSFASVALAKGAKAILTEPDAASVEFLDACAVPVISVPNVRARLSEVAELVYGHPSRKLPIVGITGTNGKTTTALLVEQALTAVGSKPGRLGTVGTSFGGTEVESNLTTPEADELTRFFSHVLANGGTQVVMEVSSHSISQGRVSGIRFDVAAFTNLTQDHLDFHGSMEKYEATKLELFTRFQPRVAVVNVTNEAGHRFAAAARSSRTLRVGLIDGCDVRPVDIKLDPLGLRGDVLVAGRKVALNTRLVGEHNLENILLSIGILEALGVDVAEAVRGWQNAAVPGRLERCDGPEDDILVLVDYAHTPDALERALSATRPLTQGKLHCLFGCGGDRDPGKRPKMGAAVGRAADRIVLTNDNPRTEDPQVIAAAVEVGLKAVAAAYEIELDRAAAIRRVILSAAPGDVVLIAGKGHEPYQILGAQKYPFDDRVEARTSLSIRRSGTHH